MKVFKPSKLSILTRCFEHQRQYRMGVCVLGCVPMGRDDVALLAEQDLWKFAAVALQGEGTLDATIPKIRAEYLVHGSAYAPEGKPATEFGVRAEVGSLRKDLVVRGDRFWAGRRATEPVPRSTLRLGWNAAFGGPSHPHNPLGKGIDPVEIATEGPTENPSAVPLPNLELPDQPVRSPEDRPTPGGLGPIDISWPQRRRLAGTHDQTWLETQFPGHPTDVDWGLHNAAPRDQQQDAPWKPGDAYRFTNLHPERAVQEGTLPSLVARAFVVRSHARGEPRPTAFARTAASRAQLSEDAALEEVELGLHTLWFFPDQERLVMAWTGVVEVAEEEGADIVKLVLAAETPDEPRPVSHYASVLADRLDEEFGALAALRDQDLLPHGLGDVDDPDDEDDIYALHGLPIENGQRQREELFASALEHLKAEGIDPAEFGLEAPPPAEPQPTLEELPAFLAEKRAELEAAKAEGEAMRKELLAKAAAVLEKTPSEGGAELTAEGLSDAVSEVGGGPPTFRAEAQRAQLQALAVKVRMSGAIDDNLESMLDDPAQHAHWRDAETKLLGAYRKTAHHQAPAPRLTGRTAGHALRRFLDAIGAGGGLHNQDFTGAVLRGLDLRGANLSGGLFESADFTECDLRGANLDDAVLAHAKIDRARLDRATLRRANMGKARLVRSVLDSARLDDAVLEGARLKGSRFRGVVLTGASVRDMRLTDCDGQRLEGADLQLLGVELERVTFEGANLERALFLELDLRTCTFADASLRECTFVRCDLREANLSGAVLEGARAVEETRLEGANLVEASLRKANFRGLRMKGADLRKAQLDESDFTEADLEGAKLYRAYARKARFDVANLRGAEMLSINLMQASLARATIEDSDLRGANLHGADMARVRTNAAVKLDDALLTRVRIHPRLVREEPPQ